MLRKTKKNCNLIERKTMGKNMTAEEYRRERDDYCRKERRRKPSCGRVLEYAISENYAKNSYGLFDKGRKIIGDAQKIVDNHLEELVKVVHLYLGKTINPAKKFLYEMENNLSKICWNKEDVIKERIKHINLTCKNTSVWKEEFLLTLMAISAIEKADSKKYINYNREEEIIERLNPEKVRIGKRTILV